MLEREREIKRERELEIEVERGRDINSVRKPSGTLEDHIFLKL